MNDRYKPEVYAKFKYEMRLLDKPSRAFVLGLKDKFPDAWNELAGIAYDFGGVAMVYAIRACMDVSTDARRKALQTAGYAIINSEVQP